MKVIVPTRKYNMTDDKFLSDMSWLCSILRQDINILIEYGITEDKIAFIEQLYNRIKVFPYDAKVKYTIVGKTEELDAACTALVEEIRIIIVRAKACFGAKSTFIKNLRMSKVGNFSYDKLITSAKAMIPALETALPELADYGFTVDTINSLSAKIKAAEDAWQARKNMMDERINITIERINLSNELYEKVAMYAEIAKAVFVKSNPAKYKTYLLTQAIKQKPGEESGAMVSEAMG